MSLTKYRPITARQLREAVADYSASLPEWTVADGGLSLIRVAGPIKQMIWFQKMSYAAYRPTHVINITPLKMPRMLHQVLDVKNREVEYSLHGRKWRDVLAAMEEQFEPNIRQSLSVERVLALCETEAQPNKTNDLTVLAVVHAWLGHGSKALEYCAAMQRSATPTVAPMPDWEASMRSFGNELARAIKAGAEREFLMNAADRVASNKM